MGFGAEIDRNFIFLLANPQPLCYHVFVTKIKGFRKGGLTMQKNRRYQNKIEELTIKGTALRKHYR